MLSLLLLTVLLGPPDEKPKPRPAAMLLDLRGKAEIRTAEGQSKTAEPGDLLFPGERLAVPAGGSATLVILGAGARETIKPGAEATVGLKGCSPPDSVATRKEQPRAVAAAMKNLRPAPGDGRKAGVGFRSGPRQGGVSPIPDSTVPGDRPGFAWPPSPGASRYRLELRVDGAEAALWTAESTTTGLDYPEDRKPLSRGGDYFWTVIDDGLRTVATGKFSVASAAEVSSLAEAAALRASEDRADRFLAVYYYQHLHAYREAIDTAEDLNRRWPDEPAYRKALADLLRVTGKAETP